MSKFSYLFFVGLLMLISTADSRGLEESAFTHESNINWKTNAFPIHHWKTLIGGGAGSGVNPEDILFGTWELAPYAIYHGHKHETPEIYYIISGKARWTVGEETQEVTSGTAIYTKPGAVHKMTNLLDEPLRAVWVWWAPNGDKKVFNSEYIFTEEAPVQPEKSGFNE